MTINLVGQTFGKLVVTEKLPAQYYLCRCACGSITKAHYNHLRYRRVKSCGCSMLDYQQLAIQRNAVAKAKRAMRLSGESRCGAG